ncbi:hypothetical protein [Desulfothermus okinawensis]
MVTFLVVLVVEKLTFKIVGVVFKSHLKEMEKIELKILEYQELMVLALAAKEKDAYKGLNKIADELYWKVFFRKLVIFSTSFFLLFSPYILFSLYFLNHKIKNTVGIDFVVAISFFMAKTIFQYIKNVLDARKEYKESKLSK